MMQRRSFCILMTRQQRKREKILVLVIDMESVNDLRDGLCYRVLCVHWRR